MQDSAAARGVEIDQELIVGRDRGCDLCIDDQRLSRKHARFYVSDGRLFLEDLGSPNGTFVNGRKVRKVVLSDGDIVALGKSTVRVGDPPGGVPAPAPSDEGPQPNFVKPVELALPPDLEDQVAREYFDALGFGDQTLLDAKADALESVVQKTRNFVILHEVSKRIQREHDPKKMLTAVLDLLLNVTGADRGYVVMLDENKEHRVEIRRSRGRRAPSRDTGPKLSRTVLKYVLEERCGVICADATHDERFESSESLFLSDTRALMAAPILVQNRVLGLIEVEATHLTSKFVENDLDLMSVTASTVGVALDNLLLTDKLVRAEQLAAIGRLATGIAHEVKNHLSPFMLADMIAKRYPDDRQIQDAAEIMLEAQHHILDLVNEIRSFVSGTPTEIHLEPQDLASVVESVVRFMQCDAAVKRNHVVKRIEDRPVVMLDQKSFRQVLVNLLRNAADAIDHDKGQIEIGVAERSDHVIVAVRDNGRGIPEDARERLFEPFFTTKGERGLGLGLDISKKIIEGHGGTLSFSTELGAGTTFWIKLPLN